MTYVYTYSTCGPQKHSLSQGKYLLQVWGAQGGSAGSGTPSNTNPAIIGAYRGYSKGILTLTSRTTVYILLEVKVNVNQELLQKPQHLFQVDVMEVEMDGHE
jgi:hypothetical protein